MGGGQIDRGRLAGFCVAALGIQALATLTTTFLPEFYANAIGIPVASVGAAFMTVRVLDLMIDPFLGGLMDATRARWGRFRPWFLASAPVLAVSILMLFEAKGGASLGYLWLWLFVLFLGFSMIVLSHLAWTATLSTARTERTRIFAWWQIFATAGQFSILAILPAVARAHPGDPSAGVHAAGWVMATLVPLSVALALWAMPERPPSDPALRRSHLADYVALFAQGAVIRLVLADLAIALSTGIASAVALFFYMGQLGFNRAVASGLILISYSAAFAGTPLFSSVAHRVGKAKALQIGAVAQGLLQLAVALQPPNQFWLTAATVAALGLCIPIAWFLPRALMADVADASRTLFGTDRTGLLYATLNGTMKLALGLAVGLAFLFLGWLGFDPSDASNPRNALPLRTMIGVAPAMLSFAVALFMHRYPEAATRRIGDAGSDRVATA